MEHELDPDEHFYKDLDKSCDYFTEEQFKENVDIEGHLSVIHINSRSIWKNIDKIKQLLQPLCKFSIIAVSETWLDNDKISEVQIEGYELFTVNRQGKRGGGVALYVDSALHCRYIDNKSIAMSNIFECVTVEIDFQTLKKLQVTCVYRTPGSSIDIFNEKMN